VAKLRCVLYFVNCHHGDRKRLFAFLFCYSLLSECKFGQSALWCYARPTFVPLTLAASTVFFIAATLTSFECCSGRRESVGETRES
jgi:hypothetical protein